MTTKRRPIDCIRGDLDPWSTMSPKAMAVTDNFDRMHYAQNIIRSGLGFILGKRNTDRDDVHMKTQKNGATSEGGSAEYENASGTGTVKGHMRVLSNGNVVPVREHYRHERD
jgi:hypothetical protein